MGLWASGSQMAAQRCSKGCIDF